MNKLVRNIKRIVYRLYRFIFINYDNLIKAFYKPQKAKSPKKQVLILANLGLGDAINFICVADKYNTIFPKEEYEITVICPNVSYELLKQETNFDHYYKYNILSAFALNKNPINRIKHIKFFRQKEFDVLIEAKWPATDLIPELHVANIIKADKKYISIIKPALQLPYRYIKKIYTDIFEVDKLEISNLEMYNFLAISIAKSRKIKVDERITYKKQKDIKISIKLPKEYYIVFPSSSLATKNWEVEKYIELIKKIYKKTKLPVVFCGTNHDKEIVETIEKELDEKMYLDILGKTSPMEFIQVIKDSRFVITNDTGAYHIAVINEVPVAIITGGYTFDGFVKYDFKGNKYKKPYIIVDKERKCFNCHYRCIENINNKFPCIESIKLDYAWSIVEKMIDENYKKKER